MLNEAAALLLAIAGVSAGFVAILGGFIASRLIAINSDRDAAESGLQEVKYQKFLMTEERDMLRRSLVEEDSILYLRDHFEELVENVDLKDVYEESEPQALDFEDIFPYWEKAQVYIKRFDEAVEKENSSLNNHMIPCELAEEYREDIFAYEFLMMYAEWSFSEDFESMSMRPRGEWYEKTREHVMYTNMQAAALDVQEQRYSMDLKRAMSPRGMGAGLWIFALFSLLNIIMPLLLSVVVLSEQWCILVMYASIGLLLAGLGSIFIYLSLMLKPKYLKSEVKEIMKDLNKH